MATGRELVIEVLNELKKQNIRQIPMAEFIKTIVANSNITEVTVRYYIRELAMKGKIKIKGKRNYKIIELVDGQ